MNRFQSTMLRVLGLKAAVPASDLSALDSRVTGMGWNRIREPFSGAWQRNVECDAPQDLLAFSAIYACVSLIADDIAKLDLCLKALTSDGVLIDAPAQSPFWRVLRKPNAYQTAIQFLSQWVVSKLLHGNAYVLKEREPNRGMVTALYVLDPRLVTARVTVEGDIWYEIRRDDLAGVRSDVFVPASEVIHDRCITPWHPLVGLSPIYAAGTAATQGRRIQTNSAAFFENMSRPSGVLTTPNVIDDPTAARLKKQFEEEFSGGKLGRLLVGGSGLKYEPMTIPATDAQLVEQLKWTVEDVCRCYHIPPHKLLAGPALALNNVGALAQEYMNTALQIHMESIESLLEDGLELTQGLCIEFDTDGLLRMDPLGQAETDRALIQAAVLAPNEARAKRNLAPVEGGDTPYLQIQNASLSSLAKRDAQPSPPVTAPTDASPPNMTPSTEKPPAASSRDAELWWKAFRSSYALELVDDRLAA